MSQISDQMAAAAARKQAAKDAARARLAETRTKPGKSMASLLERIELLEAALAKLLE